MHIHTRPGLGIAELCVFAVLTDAVLFILGFYVFFCIFSCSVNLIISVSAVTCVERLVYEMAYSLLRGMLNYADIDRHIWLVILLCVGTYRRTWCY